MNHNNFYKKIISAFLAIAMIAGVLSAYTSPVYAAINKQINYQGKLTGTSNVAVADGTYAIEFKLYTQASGGVAVWTETLTGSNEVTVTNGLFSVMLGSTTPFTGVDFNQTLYLGVNIEADGEMTPRKVIGAVPAAFVADTLDNLSSEQFIRTDAQNSTSTSSTFLNVLQSGAGKVAEFFGQASASVLALLSNGNVGVGTSTPYAKLSVAGTIVGQNFVGTSTATSTFGGNLAINGTGTSTSAGGINLSEGCYAVNGTCITNSNYGNADVNAFIHASTTIPKTYTNNAFTGINTFAGNVGIGTTSPYAKLSVAGQVVGNYFTATNTSVKSSFAGGIHANNTSTFFNPLDSTILTINNYSNTSLTSSDGIINIGDESVDQTMRFVVDGGLVASQIGSSGDSFFGVGGSGSVGVGIDTPLNRLHVDSGAADGAFRISNTNNTSSYVTMGVAGATNEIAAGSQVGDFVLTTEGGTNALFSASGNSDLTVTSGGNVAVGTNLPSRKLTVNDASNTYLSLNAGDVEKWVIGSEGSSADRFAIYNTSLTSYALNITSANNYVGIGTTSPFMKLSVAGSANFDGFVRAGRFVATSSVASTLPYASTTGITVTGTASTTNLTVSSLLNTRIPYATTGGRLIDNSGFTFSGTQLVVDSNTSSGSVNIKNTSAGSNSGFLSVNNTASPFIAGLSNGDFGIKSDFGNLAFSANNGTNAHLFIANSTGNIGVGTTSPVSKLDVYGNIRLSGGARTIDTDSFGALGGTAGGNLTVSAGGGSTSSGGSVLVAAGSGSSGGSVTISGGGASGAGGSVALVSGGGPTSGNVSLLSASNGQIFINSLSGNININPTSANLILATSSANVGIGTTSPYAKLSVAGQIVGSYFTGTSTATSTFGGNLAINGTGTTTSAGGFNISAGCFAVNNVCLTNNTYSNTDVNAYIHASTTIPKTYTANTFTALQTFGNASTTQLSVSNTAYFPAEGRWTAAGLVGIGTTSPSAKLAIAGVSSAIPSILITDGPNEAPIFSLNGDTDVEAVNFLVGDSFHNRVFELFADVTNPRALFTGVNVGIGTTSPFAKLSVVGDIYSTGTTTSNGFRLAANNSFYIGDDVFVDAAGNINATILPLQDTASNLSAIVPESGQMVYETDTKYSKVGDGVTSVANIEPLALGTIASSSQYYIPFYSANGRNLAGTSSLVVKNQRLGINNINPLYMLDVETIGNSSGGVLGIYNQDNNIDINSTTDINISGENVNVTGGAGITLAAALGDATLMATGGNINFNIDPGFNFLFNGAGNIGVGTTSPYAKLSVAGQIVGASFVSTTTATSTFGGGINIASGCFAVNNVCLSTGGSYGNTDVNAYIHASTTIPKTYTANTFTALQTFGNASTSQITSTGSAYFATAGGNVGVGTTSPIAKLTVAGDSYIGGAVSATGTLTVYDATGLTAVGSISNTGLGSFLSGSGSGAIRFGANVNTSGTLSNSTRKVGRIVVPSYSNPNNNVAIFSADFTSSAANNAFFGTVPGGSAYGVQNIIFTTTPDDSTLGSGSGVKTSLALTNGNGVGIGDGYQASFSGLTYNPAATLDVRGASNSSTPYFTVSSTTGATNQEFFRVANNGNIGVGTTSPYAKLSVAGQIVGASFVSTTTATSTFGGGINIASGCFAVNGTCVGSGGSLSGGTAGMLSAWTSGSTLTATGTPTFAAFTATSSSATSVIAGTLSVGQDIGIQANKRYNFGDSDGFSWMKFDDQDSYGIGLTSVNLFAASSNGNTPTFAFVNGEDSLGTANIILPTDGSRLGIGQIDPQYPIDVYSSNSTAVRIQGSASSVANWQGRIITGGQSVAFLMGERNNQAWLGAHDASLSSWSDFYLNPDGGNKLYLGSQDAGGEGVEPVLTVTNASGNSARVGIGNNTSPAAKLHVLATSEQLRLGYDASNYLSATVGSAGAVAFDAIGTGANFSFADNVGIGTTSPYAKLSVAGTIVGQNFVATSSTATSTIAGALAIGTSSATYKLHVTSNTSSSNGALFENLSGSTVIAMNRSGAGVNGVFRYQTAGVDRWDLGLKNDVTDNFALTDTTNLLVRMYFKRDSSGGFIGLGTTSPTAKLHIDTENAAYVPLKVSGFVSQTANLTEWLDAGKNVMSVVTANGSLGIGTTSPYAKLSVVGETVAQNFTATSTSATSTFQGTILAQNGGNVGIGTTSPKARLGMSGGIGVNPTQLYLDSNGSVGVNTVPNSAYSLDVSGNMRVSGTFQPQILTVSQTTDAYMTFNESSPGRNAFIELYNGQFHIQNRGTGSGAPIYFETSNTYTNPDMVITGGSVGIGTTSPVSTLAVVGTTTVTGNIVPGRANTYSLGTAALPWKDLYVSSTTIYIDSLPLTSVNGNLTFNSATLATSSSGRIYSGAFVGTSTATSTFGGGINIASGCFAVNNVCLSTGGSYGNTDVNAYVHASTTIAKAYSANTFTALNTFGAGLISQASTTIGNGTATGGLTISGRASTTDLYVLDDIYMPDSAIQFGNGLTNRIYGNNDAIEIATNGAKRIEANYGGPVLFFDESSNVRASIEIGGDFGIGIENPTSRLHVVDGTVAELKFNSGAANLTPALAVGNTNPSGKFAGLIAGTSGAGFYFDDSGFFDIVSASKSDYDGNSLGAAGTTRFTIDSVGNVGIGTTSPYAKLSVAGQVVGEYFTATSTTATSTFGGAIGIGTTTPAAKLGIAGGWFTTATSTGMNGINLTAGCFAINNVCLSTGGSYGNTDVNAYIHASTTIAKTYTANTFAGAQTFSGGVTIGSLTGPLQAINGVVSASSTLSLAYGGTGASSFGQGWIYATGNGTALAASTSPTVNYIVATSSVASKFLYASTTAFSSLGSAYFGTSGGNVGIGTTSPYARLSVVGQVVGQYFTATSTTASVFPYASTTAITAASQVIVGAASDFTDSLGPHSLYVEGANAKNVIAVGNTAGNVRGAFYVDSANNSPLQIGTITNTNFGFFTNNGFPQMTAYTNGALGIGDYGNLAGAPGPANGIMVSGSVGIGTTTPYAKLSVVGDVVAARYIATTTATSTFGGGINIASGCFAVNGTCVGGSTGSSASSTLLTDANTFGGTQTFNNITITGSCTGCGSGSLSGGTAGMLSAWTSGTSLTATGTPTFAAFTATSSTATSTIAGILRIGTAAITSLPNAPFQIGGNVDGYLQSTIQNLSTGASASSDFIATSNVGSDSTYFVDLGINNSGFNDPNFTIATANQAYLYTSSASLAIGTATTSATEAIKFFAGGTLAANEVMRIGTNGSVGIGTTSPWARLSVMGNSPPPEFVIATSSGVSPLFYVDATTTGAMDWARIGIGTSTLGAAGLRDQLVVSGRIYSTWREVSCDSLGASMIAALSADTPNFCGPYALDVNTDGRVVLPVASPAFGRLEASFAGVASANEAVTVRTALITARGENPVYETKVKIPSFSTSTMTLLGFYGSAMATGTPGTMPANGAFFIATSTNTWIAMTRSNNAVSYTNTNIATSTSFQKLRIEMTSNDVTYLINDTIAAYHNSNVPTAALSPTAMVAIVAPGASINNHVADVQYIRAWIDDPPTAIAGSEAASSSAYVEPSVILRDLIASEATAGGSISMSYVADKTKVSEEGTIVSFDTAHEFRVRASKGSYDSGIAGVVSTNSTSAYGTEHQDTLRVATAGRAMVRVSAENGPIKIGDYITSSSEEGVGMRATRTGNIIGRALQNLTASSSETMIAVAIEPGRYVEASSMFAFNESSQDNITNLTHGIDWVRSLRPISFNYKADGSASIGFSPEEVKSISPSLVSMDKDGKPLSVRYELLPAVLVNAVKDLDVRVTRLEAMMASSTMGVITDATSTMAVVIEGFKGLGTTIENGIASFKNIFADKVTTKEICLDDLCVTKEELKLLLENANVNAHQPPIAQDDQNDTETDVSTSTATTTVTVIPTDDNATTTSSTSGEVTTEPEGEAQSPETTATEETPAEPSGDSVSSDSSSSGSASGSVDNS